MSNSRSDRAVYHQRVLAVLGMHRSGTSLVANVVRKLGVATGKELMGPNEFNQSGYGEDIHVVRLHDALLASLDRSWNTVKGTFPLPTDWTKRPEFDVAREQLAIYLRSEFARADGGVWAVKDPRMSMLLPLWFRLERDLDFEMMLVLCVRSPDAVAASIEKRDNIPSDLGRLIWLQFNAAIVTQAGDRMKAVLDYDDWFTDPDKNLSRLAATLGRQVRDNERSEILEDIVNSRLRHHARGAPQGLFGNWQRLLEQWTNEQKLPPLLLQAAENVHEFLAAFDPWRQTVTNDKYLAVMIDSREAERKELLAAANRNLAAYRKMDEEFMGAKTVIARLEAERDEVLAVANRNLDAYRTVVTERDQALAITQSLQEQYDQNLAMTQSLQEQYDQNLAITQSLQEQYKDLARRYNLVMRRYDFFPLSLLMPADARMSAREKPKADDKNSAG